ncbi:MAG TPA: L-histidine N(alpha)-methyltransferase [Polyangiaceae bacterium]
MRSEERATRASATNARAVPAPAPARGSIAADVRRGLTRSPKALPPYLFYDAEGSRLYEQITELEEYYLTRAEREILRSHAKEIVALVSSAASPPLQVIELGAGSATKTGVLLRAVVERQGRCAYAPIDISPTALMDAERRLRTELPEVSVSALPMTHEKGLRALRGTPAPRVVLFIGSSIGNMDDDEASALLGHVRTTLGDGTWLLLGTDLRKDPRTLIAAYDDAAGVTAAFNKNLLVRLNRELGANFELGRFRHVARWNEDASRVEMHLESLEDQEVVLDALALRVRFTAGETIHTESSVKYDLPRVERLLSSAGFERRATYQDRASRFGLHLALALPPG